MFSNKKTYRSLLHLLGVIILFLSLSLSIYLCVSKQAPVKQSPIRISLSTRTEFYPWSNILFQKVLFYQVYKVLFCLKQSLYLNCLVEISCSQFFLGITSSFVYESITNMFYSRFVEEFLPLGNLSVMFFFQNAAQLRILTTL